MIEIKNKTNFVTMRIMSKKKVKGRNDLGLRVECYNTTKKGHYDADDEAISLERGATIFRIQLVSSSTFYWIPSITT